jgi:hypothetical protein
MLALARAPHPSPPHHLTPTQTRTRTHTRCAVHAMLTRFTLDNAAQEAMMSAVVNDGLSVMQASCEWLQSPDNRQRWHAWLPADAGGGGGGGGGSEKRCSKAELQALTDAPDPVAAVMAMLQTNPACALCVVPCRSQSQAGGVQRGLYGARCIWGCASQDENACREPTGLGAMRPLIDRAALHDRETILRLLELADAEYAAGPHRLP